MSAYPPLAKSFVTYKFPRRYIALLHPPPALRPSPKIRIDPNLLIIAVLASLLHPYDCCAGWKLFTVHCQVWSGKVSMYVPHSTASLMCFPS